MNILTTTQRDDAWFTARLGFFTASRAADMMATIKNGEAAARRDLRLQIVLERLTSRRQDPGYVSVDMQRGTDKEPDALAAYEAESGSLVQAAGFVAHDELQIGCSPDGVVGFWDGLVEVKCPKSATHLSYLRAGVLPKEYRYQIVHALLVTGARWADFVSFDDRFPESLRLFRVRVDRDEKEIASYLLLARMFLSECEKEHAEIMALAERGMVAA